MQPWAWCLTPWLQWTKALFAILGCYPPFITKMPGVRFWRDTRCKISSCGICVCGWPQSWTAQEKLLFCCSHWYMFKNVCELGTRCFGYLTPYCLTGISVVLCPEYMHFSLLCKGERFLTCHAYFTVSDRVTAFPHKYRLSTSYTALSGTCYTT
jgi:hypothetical protein